MNCVYTFHEFKTDIWIICVTMESFRNRIIHYLVEEKHLGENDVTFIITNLTNNLLPNLQRPFSSDWTADRHFVNYNGMSFRADVRGTERDSPCFHCPDLKDGCLQDYNSQETCDECPVAVAYYEQRRQHLEPKSLKDIIRDLFRRRK